MTVTDSLASHDEENRLSTSSQNLLDTIRKAGSAVLLTVAAFLDSTPATVCQNNNDESSKTILAPNRAIFYNNDDDSDCTVTSEIDDDEYYCSLRPTTVRQLWDRVRKSKSIAGNVNVGQMRSMVKNSRSLMLQNHAMRRENDAVTVAG